MYALVKDGKVIEYPTSINAWRESNRNISLPAEPTESQLNEVGIYKVQPATKPFTSVNEIPELSVELVDSKYKEIWNIREATQEELSSNIKKLTEEIVQQVQLRLDTFANTKNYDGILSACTYATSVNPKFKAEGQYCVEARDNTWGTLYQILEEVQAGTRPAPNSYQDIEPELPTLVWPN